MGGVRDFMARAALALSLLLPVYFLAGALATKLRLIDWRIGYALLGVRLGPWVILGVAAFAVLALLMSLQVSPRRGRRIAAAALLTPLIALGYRAVLAREAGAAPPIHEVSTDITDPPSFSPATAAARAETPCANPLDLVHARVPNSGAFAGRAVVAVQQQIYPDIQPVIAAPGPAQTYDLALAAARAQHWIITNEDRAHMRFEARTETFWYGLIDDIAVRIRSNPPGAIVDVRDAARVGESDQGASAHRVRAYIAALKAKLAAAL